MSFQTTKFLGELFDISADEPTPLHHPQTDPAVIPGDRDPDFSDWVLRPDHTGRPGWEPAGLPEAVAWWWWAGFEDLPEPDGECLGEKARRLRGASGLPPKPVPPRPGECPRCRSSAVREVTIHSGQSVRRNCGRCGWLFGFPVWYGKALSDRG